MTGKKQGLRPPGASIGVWLVAVLIALVTSSGTAHGEGGSASAPYELFAGKWQQPSVQVVYNWSEAVCGGPYGDPDGSPTPTIAPAVATEVLRDVLAILNEALDGALVLEEAGPGAARRHCGETRATGDIAVGWSPLVPGVLGNAPTRAQGTPQGVSIVGAGVVLSTTFNWTHFPVRYCDPSGCRTTWEKACPSDPYGLLRHAMLHEMMHAIGIMHSSVPGAVMGPSSGDCGSGGVLHQDDLAALKAQYPSATGAPATGGAAPPAPTPPAASPLGSVGLAMTSADLTPEDLRSVHAAQGCDARILAIAVDGRMRVYVVGAPAFVNAEFPATLPAQTPYVFRCAA